MRLYSRPMLLGACLQVILPAGASLASTPGVDPRAAPARIRTEIPPDSAASTMILFKFERLQQIPATDRKRAFAEYVEVVRAALDAGDHARALALSERACVFWKDLRRPLLHRAAAQVEAERWGDAVASARAASKARSDTMQPPPRPSETEAAAAYWEGLGLYHTQRYDEALPRLRAAASQARDWAEAGRALGEACFVSGRMEEAAAAYARALRSDASVGSARDLAYYAEARASQGDLDGAIGSMQEALRRFPYAAGLHANLANLLRKDGDRLESYYHFTLELLLHGTDGRFAAESLRAVGDLLDEMDKRPNDPGRNELLLVSAGLSELRAGHAGSAAQNFERAARMTRTPTLLPQLLFAEALLRSGEAAPARDQLEQLLNVEPDFVPALVLLADAQRALGAPDQARLRLQRAYALFPTYWKLRLGAKSG